MVLRDLQLPAQNHLFHIKKLHSESDTQCKLILIAHPQNSTTVGTVEFSTLITTWKSTATKYVDFKAQGLQKVP